MATLTPSARAANRFWTGAVNGNLSNASNYNPAGTPVAGDDLIFQANALVTRLVVTNDFSPNRAFETITFQGSNYVIRGNALLVTNGITSLNSFGPNTIDADVDVRGFQIWTATGPLATLDFNGDINLNANTLTVRAATGDFFFSGIVSGTGNLVKTNVGTLRMDGSAGHNTYSGFTRFDGGVLELDKFAIFPVATNFISIPGDLTIGDGNGLVGTDVLRLLADDQIANTSDVTVKNSGLFDLNGNSDHIASLTMQGGTVDTGTGTLFLGGNLTTLADNNTALIEGHLSLGGASRTFDINSGPPGADCRINAIISSDTISLFTTAGFTKTGGGSLFLAGTNTYNGTTTINEGQVALLADRALGATTTPLGASAGAVVNGDGNLFLSGVQVTNEDLTINSSNPGGAFNASGASIWTGDILLNTDTFISSSGSLLLIGQISGVGGFTKLSAGSLTLGGTNANNYIGTTTVRDGTLLLDKDSSVVLDGAMSGPLVVGEDELPENTDIVRWLHASQLPDDTDITINASGLVDLNGFGENVRNIIFDGGDLDAPLPGSILPTGDITVNRSTNSQAILSGRMSVLSNPIINVTGHFFSPDLSISALLFGAGGITKNGVGEVALTAANTYSGTTTVNDGFLEVDNSSALGTTAGGTVVNSGGVLALRFGIDVPAEALTLAGTGQSGFGALSSSFGSNSWAGTVTLSANATISVDTGDFLNLLGGIGGGFNLTKTGTGTLIFSGSSANTFNNLTVNAGTLQLNKTVVSGAFAGDLTIGDGSGTDTVRLLTDNQIPDTSTVTMASGAVFDLNDQNESTEAIGGFGQIDLGTGILREGSDNGSSTFAGTIIGTGQVFKLGTGTWTLNGNNSYSGHTTVSAGTLSVNGSQASSDVTVNGTATLSGDGIVSDLDVFGNLRPGSSPAILTTSNFVFHSASSDFFVELNGPVAGTGYDQVNVRGSVGLSNATLHVVNNFPLGEPSIGDQFTIINNDGADAIIGTFSGLTNGATFTVGDIGYRINYNGGTGNDVVLTVVNALGASVTINATDRGWYDDTGLHNPDIANYLVGELADGTQYHDWFVFNVPSFAGTIVQAELLINCYSNVSPNAQETYVLRDVSTSIATLVAGGAGLTGIYADLADGPVYSVRDLQKVEAGERAIIPLNLTFINDAAAAAGGQIALGGSIPALSTNVVQQSWFGFSGTAPSDIQLRLTFGTSTLLNASDRGWYDNSGNHTATNDNYFVGESSDIFHNFFVFNLPALTSPLLSAQLFVTPYTINSPTNFVNYLLHDVSTPVITLSGNASGATGIFTDLGTGGDYGGRYIFTNEPPAKISIPLNNQFVGAASASSGGQIALGGSLVLDPTPNNERLFAFGPGVAVPTDVQLWLGFIPGTLPSSYFAPGSPTALGANRYQFVLTGTAGTTNEIQTTTDLVNWDVARTLYMTNVNTIFNYTSTISPRFFRARLVQ